MPEVRHSRSVDRPLSEIWSFVQDFDNWAPLLAGYVSHAVESDRVSRWTLRGELGPFSRTVEVKVQITEWTAPRRVAFVLDGLDEAVHGEGAFDLADEPALVVAPPPRPWWRRWLDRLLGRSAPTAAPGRTVVVFAFGVEAGGPMGPMVNALLGPWTDQVARDLLDRVGARLEAA